MHSIGGHTQERQKTSPIQLLLGKHFPCANLQGCQTCLSTYGTSATSKGANVADSPAASSKVGAPIVNPAPLPRVAPKTKRPIVHEPVAKLTCLNTAPIYNPIALRTLAKTKKSLTFTPAQAARRYYPQALLALWCTPIQEMATPVLYAETGKTLGC